MTHFTQQPERIWRSMAFIVVILNVAFNYVSEYFMPGQSVTAITHKYLSVFAPADYAFSIWSVIYITFIIYAIYQLLPSQRNRILFDHLAMPFIASNVLAMVWVTLYRMDFIIPSMLVIVTMLVLSVILYVKVRNMVLRHDYPNWISTPFSLFLGWLTVATIANADILILSQDWISNPTIQLLVSVTMILVVGSLGIFISYRCADFIFQAVTSWACIAIFIAQANNYSIAIVALLSAALPLVWFLLTVVKRAVYRHKIDSNKLSFDETMRLKLNSQNKLFFGRL